MINDKKTVVNAGGVNKNSIKLSAKQFETITTNVNVSNNRIKIEPICKGKDFDQTWLHLSIAKFKRVKDTNEPIVSLPSQVKTLECDAMSGGNQCSKESFDITDCVQDSSEEWIIDLCEKNKSAILTKLPSKKSQYKCADTQAHKYRCIPKTFKNTESCKNRCIYLNNEENCIENTKLKCSITLEQR